VRPEGLQGIVAPVPTPFDPETGEPAPVALRQIARALVDAGLNGIAYPAEGIVAYAQARGLTPKFVDACCGVNW